MCAATSFAQVVQDVAINEINFPDTNFRNSILAINNNATVLTANKIKSTYSIDVSNKYIADLKGIEFFTALTSLKCNNNQLTSLDLSKLTGLEQLFCSNNQLRSINVQGLINMKYFNCDHNQLSSLNVSDMTSVMGLNCSFNKLSLLDVSKLRSLKSLECQQNQLFVLDVALLIYLESLICHDNELSALDLSGAANITNLDCSFNQLSALDISDLINLEVLTCNNNQIAALDVSNSPKITKFWCMNNKLSSLDVSALTKLSISEFSNQTPTLTLTNRGSDYRVAISLNNPTELRSGITYDGTNLISNNKEIKTSSFKVNVPGSGVKMTGSFTFNYEESTSIPKINAANRQIVGYYSIIGAQLPEEPQNGIYIILYDNGTAEKVMKK